MLTLAILITYYSERNLLTECLLSLLGGAVQPDEILIYDDCSSVPPDEFIPSQAKAIVRVIRGEVNQGPAFGRNELMKIAQCDYVHFHDSDDLFKVDWCKEIRAAINDSDPDVIVTDVESFDETGVVSNSVMGLKDYRDEDDLVIRAIRGSFLVPSCTFKRSLGLKLGGYRTRDMLPQSEDFDFHIRLIVAAQKYVCIPKPLILQRLRQNSHSQNKTSCWTSALNSITLLKETIPTKYHPALSNRAAELAATLYVSGHYAEVRWGFALAQLLGKPDYAYRTKLYQIIAKSLGPIIAERFACVYRRFIPQNLRAYVRFSR